MRQFALITLLFILGLIVGCGSSTPPNSITQSTTPQMSTTTTTVPTTISNAPTVNLDGTWKMEDGNDKFSMVAIIEHEVITVLFMNDSTKFLYWNGSFQIKDPTYIISAANKDAMSISIMGSQADIKVFSYLKSKLQYEFTMQGMTKTIYLVKEGA